MFSLRRSRAPRIILHSPYKSKDKNVVIWVFLYVIHHINFKYHSIKKNKFVTRVPCFSSLVMCTRFLLSCPLKQQSFAWWPYLLHTSLLIKNFKTYLSFKYDIYQSISFFFLTLGFFSTKFALESIENLPNFLLKAQCSSSILNFIIKSSNLISLCSCFK